METFETTQYIYGISRYPLHIYDQSFNQSVFEAIIGAISPTV